MSPVGKSRDKGMNPKRGFHENRAPVFSYEQYGPRSPATFLRASLFSATLACRFRRRKRKSPLLFGLGHLGGISCSATRPRDESGWPAAAVAANAVEEVLLANATRISAACSLGCSPRSPQELEGVAGSFKASVELQLRFLTGCWLGALSLGKGGQPPRASGPLQTPTGLKLTIHRVWQQHCLIVNHLLHSINTPECALPTNTQESRFIMIV